MEIKVGEYVRNKRGYIGKIIKTRERIETYKNNRKAYLVDWGGKRATYISQFKDIKHSNNIIELIEVGDYVNGKKVIEIDDCKGSMRELYVEGQNPNEDCGIYFEQIETVLTHEQFSSLEYII